MDILSDEKIQEYKECFWFFDHTKECHIKFDDLGSAMRSLGLNPTKAELLDIIEELKEGNNSNIDFPHFLALIARTAATQSSEEEIKEGCAILIEALNEVQTELC